MRTLKRLLTLTFLLSGVSWAQQTIVVKRFDFATLGQVFNPKYAPLDPVWISFEARLEKNRTLFLANLSTLEKIKIGPQTPSPEDDDSFIPKPKRSDEYNAQLAWAPVHVEGEQWYAFVGTLNGNQDIYVGNLAQPGMTYRVTSDEGIDDNPAWSPDGQSLVFIRRRKEGADLFMIRDMSQVLSAVRERQQGDATEDPAWIDLFSDDHGEEAFPSWSPDGGYVVYTVLRSPGSDLMVRSVRTGRALRLFGSQDRIFRDGAVSPDGNLLAYFSAPASKSEATNLVIADIYLGYAEDIVRAKEKYTMETVGALARVSASNGIVPFWTSGSQLVFMNEFSGAVETINWLDCSNGNPTAPTVVRYRLEHTGASDIDLGQFDYPRGPSDPTEILVSAQEGQHFVLLSGFSPPLPPIPEPLLLTVAPTVLYYLGDAQGSTSAFGLEAAARFPLGEHMSVSGLIGIGNLEGSDKDANNETRTFVTRLLYLGAAPGYQIFRTAKIRLNLKVGGGICRIESDNDQTSGLNLLYYPELELDFVIGDNSRLSLNSRYLFLTSDADGLRTEQESDNFLILGLGFAIGFR